MALHRKETKESVRRELWRRANGMCHRCKIDLDPGTRGPSPTAETAHIIALSDGGVRADASIPIEDRNRVENLMQLCPNCHDLIDKNDAVYTTDVLTALKSKHEAWAEQLRHAGRRWNMRYASVDYMNLPRLAMVSWADEIQELAARSGLQANRPFAGQGLAPGVFVGRVAPILAEVEARAVALNEQPSDALEVAQFVSFDCLMRSVNPPASPPKRLTGKLKRDPHLRFALGGRTVRIRYDPSWLTTATAATDLHFAAREPARYAGIGLVAAVTENDIHLSAWIFGRPQSAEGAALKFILTSPSPLPRTVAIEDFE